MQGGIIYHSKINPLTLSSLNLPLSSSSTTSGELLSQFSTCSGWRWQWWFFLCSLKIKVYQHVLINQLHGNFCFKTLDRRKIKFVFGDVKSCTNALWGRKGLNPQDATKRLVVDEDDNGKFRLERVNKRWRVSICITLHHKCRVTLYSSPAYVKEKERNLIDL